ncbi:hypothetical protein DF186_14245, partial [Enterococcus hirae]
FTAVEALTVEGFPDLRSVVGSVFHDVAQSVLVLSVQSGYVSLFHDYLSPHQISLKVCRVRRGCYRIVLSVLGVHSVVCCDVLSGQVVEISGVSDDRQVLWQVEVQWWWQG